MSLIEEALRKHRQEQSAHKPVFPPPRGEEATPVNAPVLPETREPSKMRMLLLAGLNLLLVAGALAAIAWGSWRLLKHAGRLPPADTSTPGRVIAPVVRTAALAIATAPASTQPPPSSAAATNREPALPSGWLTSGSATGINAAAVLSTSPTPAQVTAPAAPGPLPVAPPPTPARHAWPHLAVSGIIQAPGNRSIAIVNGILLRQGETTQGATITAITKYGVKFEFEGETLYIRTGNSAD